MDMSATLYERLGAEAGIKRLVDGVVAAHFENPVIAPRFQPYLDQAERLDDIKAHICAFFAAGSGGPADYRGRSMPEAHRGMNVSAAEYLAATDDILQTMEQYGYDQATRNEVLAILYSLKDEIIGV